MSASPLGVGAVKPRNSLAIKTSILSRSIDLHNSVLISSQDETTSFTQGRLTIDDRQWCFLPELPSSIVQGPWSRCHIKLMFSL